MPTPTAATRRPIPIASPLRSFGSGSSKEASGSLLGDGTVAEDGNAVGTED